MKQTQCAMILQYLKEYPEVSRITLAKLPIMNITARLSNLRSKGHFIKCRIKWDTNAEGKNVKHTFYSLENEIDN